MHWPPIVFFSFAETFCFFFFGRNMQLHFFYWEEKIHSSRLYMAIFIIFPTIVCSMRKSRWGRCWVSQLHGQRIWSSRMGWFSTRWKWMEPSFMPETMGFSGWWIFALQILPELWRVDASIGKSFQMAQIWTWICDHLQWYGQSLGLWERRPHICGELGPQSQLPGLPGMLGLKVLPLTLSRLQR